jgi:hypothetical protein
MHGALGDDVELIGGGSPRPVRLCALRCGGTASLRRTRAAIR